MTGHGVALTPIWLPGHAPDDYSLWVQCECGWYARFDCPITLSRVNEIVDQHPR